MKLSVIMPVFNEAKTILTVLEKVESVDIPGVAKEIIIVDDSSKDGTQDILSTLGKRARVVYHKKNQGKGAAVRTGFAHSTGDILIVQDGDLEYDPNDWKRMIRPILDGNYQVVYGSRFLRRHKAKYQLYYLGNIFLSFATSILYFRRITDMETCYKMFTRKVLSKLKLRAKRFDIEPEITAKIIKLGYRIKEIPIWYKCRDFKEGKKISWKDGVKALFYLMKYRFVN